MTTRKKKKADEAPKLVTREIARTPVSENLAKVIREMDELLLEEFGPWFAYAILGNDGTIAASNARDSYLPPVVAATPTPDAK